MTSKPAAVFNKVFEPDNTGMDGARPGGVCVKPLLLALQLFVWLVLGGAAINRLVMALFS